MTLRFRLLTVITAIFCCLGPVAAQSTLAPPMVFVIIGPPGSGKSTRAKLLGKKYKIPPIDMAGVVQSKFRKNSPLSKALKVSLASGDLIDDDGVNDLMKTRLLQSDASRGFILDGYPRTRKQATFLDAFLKDNGLPAPKVILLESPDDVGAERIRKRRQADAAPDVIQHRLTEYHEDSSFLNEWYQAENVMRVDGTQEIPVVAARIDSLIQDALARKAFSVRK